MVLTMVHVFYFLNIAVISLHVLGKPLYKVHRLHQIQAAERENNGQGGS